MVKDKYDKLSAVISTRLTNLYRYYPWNYSVEPWGRFGMAHFSKEILYNARSFVMMKRGSRIRENLTQYLVVLHSMGILEHLTTYRLPVEADDYGK